MVRGSLFRAGLVASLLPLSIAASQSSLGGFVLVDSTRAPVPDAIVSIAALDKSVSTDERGAFRLGNLRPGRYQIDVRRIGYSPYAERVTLAANQALTLEVLLVRVRVLDSVVVTAPAVIQSFEDHRAIGLGQFMTRADLAKREVSRLSDVIFQMRGVRIIAGDGNYAWLASKRAQVTSIMNSRSARLDVADLDAGAKKGECYAQVYLDRHLVYRSGGGEPLFNLNSIPVDQIEAIEYYAGPSQTPGMYGRLNSNCGVLVIHTRRSP
jgi:hypothetical protein